MKLLKIGSSPSCDIVLHSQYVSALHAELTLLDNGEIIIVDKNSSNGTFIGNKKLEANTEATIKRGDFVRIADTDLPWAKVPNIKIGNYDRIINIGNSYRNDICINSNIVSRYHAMLKIKGNKAYISDNGSQNGTTVNGIKISPLKDVQIKKGDVVICADEDITEQIKPFIPGSIWSKIAVPAAIVAALLAIVAGFAFIFAGKSAPKDYIPATVYIHTVYHYNVTVAGVTFRYPEDTDDYCDASATGFFVDREGRIGTVRHIAVPWDEAYNTDEREKVEKTIRDYLHSQIPVSTVNSISAYDSLNQTYIGKMLIKSFEEREQLNKTLSTILSSTPMVINGEVDFIIVGYEGQSFESIDEFEKCKLIAESGDVEKDVALLQLNSKKTPDFIKKVFDLSNVNDQLLQPMKEDLYTIGYPHNLLWDLDMKDKTLNPSIRNTKCIKTPTKYNFEFQASSVGGACGSPVFLLEGVFKKKCRLVGILSAGKASEAGPTIATHAYFLRKLYEENIKPIAN